MVLPIPKIKTPPCPACGSKNTTRGRIIRLAAGLGLGFGGALFFLLLGYFYPWIRSLLFIALLCGLFVCLIPPLGKYCCLDCDAYWNPEDPDKFWRPKPPGL